MVIEVFLDKDYSSDIKAIIWVERIETAKLELWREKRPIDKLHNMVFYIICLSRCKAMYNKCQIDNLTLADCVCI